jgi:DNA-binding MarR family transcriptional regulator
MPIPANEKGEQLLVGRDEELELLIKYIKNSDTHPTLEGPNGVGKTSLVAVAGYKLQTEFATGATNQALIPLSQPFQLTTEDTAATFKRRVFYSVAQAFIDNHDLLKKRGFKVPDIDNVNLWLNSPTFGSVGGGVSILGIGGNASVSTTTNSSTGFTEAGFIATVTQWLRDCFPEKDLGGFLCNIDNLELLETSKNARSLLEAIRDEVLRLPGLRWVLCGARGIVRAAASTQRMQGVLSEPTDINPIEHGSIKKLILARLRVFELPEVAGQHRNLVAPVDEIGFEYVYQVGNNNLRHAMKYSEDFSISTPEAILLNLSAAEKLTKLQDWMTAVAEKYLAAITGVKGRAWKVFDDLSKNGGSMSPSEFGEYGFESSQALRPHIRDLEGANLVESAIDDTDDRRRTINVTSRGWIVFRHRSLTRSQAE